MSNFRNKCVLRLRNQLGVPTPVQNKHKLRYAKAANTRTIEVADGQGCI